jgi:hypothetical protein
MSQKRKDETMEAYVIRIIQEEERERCAKIADDMAEGKLTVKGMTIYSATAKAVAAAIRNEE